MRSRRRAAIPLAVLLLAAIAAPFLGDRAAGDPTAHVEAVELLPPLSLVAPTTTATTASTTTTTAAPTTTSTSITTTTVAGPAPALEAPAAAGGGRLRSTAYCLTGTMASGRPTYVGAVASNRYPLGTVLHVEPNPWGDPTMRFTVEDRHARSDADGYPTELDFAMPSECDRALQWGNRQIVTARVV